VKVELCCKRGGGGVRGLALVLTAMNLARHSKESQTPTIPNVVVDKKTKS
jgi:hypothetical protein